VKFVANPQVAKMVTAPLIQSQRAASSQPRVSLAIGVKVRGVLKGATALLNHHHNALLVQDVEPGGTMAGLGVQGAGASTLKGAASGLTAAVLATE